MKRYNELTQAELVALTEEQIKRLIEIEVAVSGIVPIECPIEPSLEKEGITASVIGYKIAGLIFLNEADAQTVANLPVMEEKYNYNVSYHYRWLEPTERKVEKVSYYHQDDVGRIGPTLKLNEEKRNTYEKAKEQYNKYLNEISGCSTSVWNTVNEAKEKQRRIDLAKRTYEKHLDLAEQDMIVAQKFFRDAFKDEPEIIEAVLNIK